MTQRSKRIWIGALLLLLAAALRLTGFQEALIGRDQSSILGGAADIVRLQRLPLVGMKSSVGVMQTATPLYLAALPLLLVRKVVSVKWFFSVLDLLALAYLYRSLGRRVGRRTAAIAGLLYATNPWLVEFNRWIWYQTLLPTFATITFSAYINVLSPVTRYQKNQALALGLISATLMGTVHVVGLPWAALLIVLGTSLAYTLRSWRGWIAGILGSLAVTAPYLVYLFRTNLEDIHALVQSGAGSTSGAWNYLILRLTREIISGAQVLSTTRTPVWRESVFVWRPLYDVLPLLLGLSILGLIYRQIRRRSLDHRALLALGWTLLAPVLFLNSDIHGQHFYLLFWFPAPFAVIGMWLGDQVNARWGRIATSALLILLVVVSCWWSYLWAVRIIKLERRKCVACTHAWMMDRATASIHGYLTRTAGDNVIVITDFEGDYSPFDWIGAFVGAPDRVRVTDVDRGLILPSEPTCYLVGPGATRENLGPALDNVEPRPADMPWSFYCRDWMLDPPDRSLARWQHAVHLLDVQVPDTLPASSELPIVYTWYYAGESFQQNYHLFNHLWEGETLVGQIDGAGVPTTIWRPGDRVLTYFALPTPATLPTATYTLKVGFYPWPDLTPVRLEDGAPALTVRRWRP